MKHTAHYLEGEGKRSYMEGGRGGSGWRGDSRREAFREVWCGEVGSASRYAYLRGGELNRLVEADGGRMSPETSLGGADMIESQRFALGCSLPLVRRRARWGLHR